MKEESTKLRELFDRHISLVYVSQPVFEMTREAYKWIEYCLQENYDAVTLTLDSLLWQRDSTKFESGLPSTVYQGINLFKLLREEYLEIRALDFIIRNSTYIDEAEGVFTLHISGDKLLSQLILEGDKNSRQTKN